MIHYIYKIVFLCGSPKYRYYIGKRSTGEYDNWKEDPYAGSGVFCDNYFSEYGKILNKTYRKECLEENESFEINGEREKYWIGDLWKLDPLCMNKIAGGAGVKKFKDLRGKPVVQYDLKGNKIAEYKSSIEAGRQTGMCYSQINNCCLHKISHVKKYIWRFSNDPLSDKDINEVSFIEIPVDMYSLDGKLVKSFPSIKAASDETKINASSISDICIGRTKTRHTAGGYFWSNRGANPRINKIKNFIGKRKVKQFTLDGVLVGVYDSLKAAEIASGAPWQAIQRVCNGKRKKTHGYKWEWVN